MVVEEYFRHWETREVIATNVGTPRPGPLTFRDLGPLARYKITLGYVGRYAQRYGRHNVALRPQHRQVGLHPSRSCLHPTHLVPHLLLRLFRLVPTVRFGARSGGYKF